MTNRTAVTPVVNTPRIVRFINIHRVVSNNYRFYQSVLGVNEG